MQVYQDYLCVSLSFHVSSLSLWAVIMLCIIVYTCTVQKLQLTAIPVFFLEHTLRMRSVNAIARLCCKIAGGGT